MDGMAQAARIRGTPMPDPSEIPVHAGLRLDCECGYRRVAQIYRFRGKWWPHEPRSIQATLEQQRAIRAALEQQRAIPAYTPMMNVIFSEDWYDVTCPGRRCNRRYRYRRETWEARINRAVRSGQRVLVLGVVDL
jgi:hypothetical protein